MENVLKCLTRAVVIFTALVCGFCYASVGQGKDVYVRIINIVVDSSYLDSFKAVLKKEIEASIPAEPGTLTLHAVYDKNNPTHVTVFEIYANKEAHQTHQQTQHFLQYKNATKDMVKSTVRFEMLPIALKAKQL